MGQKGNNYVISVNLDTDKYQELIEWIKNEADKEDRSISSLFVVAIKEYRKNREENPNG